MAPHTMSKTYTSFERANISYYLAYGMYPQCPYTSNNSDSYCEDLVLRFLAVFYRNPAFGFDELDLVIKRFNLDYPANSEKRNPSKTMTNKTFPTIDQINNSLSGDAYCRISIENLPQVGQRPYFEIISEREGTIARGCTVESLLSDLRNNKGKLFTEKHFPLVKFSNYRKCVV